jgi:hypothetical protein
MANASASSCGRAQDLERESRMDAAGDKSEVADHEDDEAPEDQQVMDALAGRRNPALNEAVVNELPDTTKDIAPAVLRPPQPHGAVQPKAVVREKDDGRSEQHGECYRLDNRIHKMTRPRFGGAGVAD